MKKLFGLFLLLAVVIFVMPICHGSDAEARATKSFLDGNWLQTVTNANQWVTEDPTNPVPHALLNVAHAGLEEIGATISERDLAYGSSNYVKRVQEWALVLVVTHKDNPRAYLLEGTAFEMGGYHQTAINMHKKAIEIDPSFVQAIENLGGIYLANNQIDAAMVVFRDLLNRRPNLSVAYDHVAICYVHKGDMSRAIQYFEKSVELDPENVNRLYNLASAYIQSGAIEKAKLVLQKIVELDPTGESGQKAKWKLSKLNERTTSNK